MLLIRKTLLLFLLLAPASFGALEDVALDVNTRARFYPVTDSIAATPESKTAATSIAEVVWSVNRGALAFKRDGDFWHDTLRFEFTVSDSAEEINRDTLIRIVEIPRGQMVSEKYLLFDKIVFDCQPGNYNITMTVWDLGDGDSMKVEKDFQVRLPATGLSISDIFLLSDISKDTTSSDIFTINGYRMLPNPSREYGASLPTLYYYVEFYYPEYFNYDVGRPAEGFNSRADTADCVLSKWVIREMTGELIGESEAETIEVESAEMYIINGLNIVSLPDGEYELILTATDPVNETNVSSSREFAVRWPSREEITRKQLAGAALEQEYNYVAYLLNTSEKAFYKKLTDDGKSEFLIRWWEKHDPTPNTPENEYRDEIIERWLISNAAFGHGDGKGESGWRTDRGRVYIIYGPPDNIERAPMSMDSNPWEQWDYFNLQGGVIFVFADVLGIGDYRLLHSTASGEISDPSWGDKILRRHEPTDLPGGSFNE
ncbi:hypothetical protein DRQ36_00960 [bacterium]|nr:MAG: hypothetical protein DRQ36_00960 [bacterium]